MSISDAKINEIIGTMDTKKPVRMHDSELQAAKTQLVKLFQFFVDVSPDLDSALTSIGLTLYNQRDVLAGQSKNLDRAFELATEKIAQHNTKNKRKR